MIKSKSLTELRCQNIINENINMPERFSENLRNTDAYKRLMKLPQSSVDMIPPMLELRRIDKLHELGEKFKDELEGDDIGRLHPIKVKKKLENTQIYPELDRSDRSTIQRLFNSLQRSKYAATGLDKLRNIIENDFENINAGKAGGHTITTNVRNLGLESYNLLLGFLGFPSVDKFED